MARINGELKNVQSEEPWANWRLETLRRWVAHVEGLSVPRKLTARAARAMSAARKVRSGGRPVKPATCPRCTAQCPSARAAAAHCAGLTPQEVGARWHANVTRD